MTIEQDETRWKPLERLAEAAPAPRGDLAERVLGRARARRRGGWVAGGVAAATAVAMLVVAGAMAGRDGNTTAVDTTAVDTTAVDPPVARPSATGQPDPEPVLTPRVAVTAIAIRAAVRSGEDDYGRPERLLLRGSACGGVELRTTRQCRRWSAAERAAIAGALAQVAPVRFSPGTKAPSALWGPSVRRTWYITTSRVRWLRPGAGQVFVVVNPGHCYGTAYQVERRSDGWNRAPFEGNPGMLIC